MIIECQNINIYQDNIKAVNKYIDCVIRCLLLGYLNLNSNK